MTPVKVTLNIEPFRVAFEFQTEADRDTFWTDIEAYQAFGASLADACEKLGTATILIDPAKMPFGHRWQLQTQ